MGAYSFKSITQKATVKGACSVEGCGKKTQITKKFEQTLNPFNKNKLGNIKTEAEIYSELSNLKRDWVKSVVLLCKDHK